MNQLKISSKWFLIFFVSFIACTIIGTQTHELGHIIVAKSLGYETTLSYGSMSYNQKGFSEDVEVIAWRKMFEEIGDYDIFSPEQKQQANALYDNIRAKYPNDPEKSFYVTLGGPAETILTAFLGLFILAYRRTNQQEAFKTLDWIGVFLSLFILREVFNTIIAGAKYIIIGTNHFRGDEFGISKYLSFNQWTIPIMTAILGVTIASFVIFMIIPKRYRFTFILAGFAGSILGFVLWFNYLGPYLFS